MKDSYNQNHNHDRKFLIARVLKRCYISIKTECNIFAKYALKPKNCNSIVTRKISRMTFGSRMSCNFDVMTCQVEAILYTNNESLYYSTKI